MESARREEINNKEKRATGTNQREGEETKAKMNERPGEREISKRGGEIVEKDTKVWFRVFS